MVDARDAGDRAGGHGEECGQGDPANVDCPTGVDVDPQHCAETGAEEPTGDVGQNRSSPTVDSFGGPGHEERCDLEDDRDGHADHPHPQGSGAHARRGDDECVERHRGRVADRAAPAIGVEETASLDGDRGARLFLDRPLCAHRPSFGGEGSTMSGARSVPVGVKQTRSRCTAGVKAPSGRRQLRSEEFRQDGQIAVDDVGRVWAPSDRSISGWRS